MSMAEPDVQQMVVEHSGDDKAVESVVSNEEQSSEQFSNSHTDHASNSNTEHDEDEPGRQEVPQPVAPPSIDTPKAVINLKDIEMENNSSPRSVVSVGRGSLDRDLVLAKLNQDRTFSLIKAWEENTKAKSLHRYNRKVAKISAWEKSMKAKAESNLRDLEERLEKEKALYIEKMKNEIAMVQMRAEEERALAEARHGEELIKAEESGAKYRASGMLPRRYPFCFTCH